MSMKDFLRPDTNWTALMTAAPFILVGIKFLTQRWQVKSLQRSVGELRAERTRLEALIAELKQVLGRR